jgi:phage tail sheath protein FI
MAEQIISPGVFTRENDQSFLPQGVGAIGAAVVGPTVKGPAFVPTVVKSFAEYERKFGTLSSDTFVPQTVREYLKNAGSVTVCRVLAGGGYEFKNGTNEYISIVASGSENVLLGVIFPSKATGTPNLGDSAFSGTDFDTNFSLTLSGAGVTTTQLSASVNPANSNYLFKQLGDSPDNSKDGVVSYGGTPGYTYINFKNLQTSIASTVSETSTITFADSNFNSSSIDSIAGYGNAVVLSDSDGAQYTVVFSGSSYAAAATVGLTGSLVNASLIGLDTLGTVSGSVLATAMNTAINTIGSFTSTLSGNSLTVTVTEGGSTTDILNQFTTSTTASVAVTTQGTDLSGYNGISSGKPILLVTQSVNAAFNGTNLSQTEGYDFASTPFIKSQFLDVNKTTKELFKFHTIAHGTATNKDFKISIANLREPSDIDNEEQYSTFSVIIRSYSDKDKSPSILEQFNGCNLDPDSPNYISRVIGDRYPQYNETLDKVELLGNFSNISDYIRVEVADAVSSKATSPKLSPKGFGAVSNPISTSSLAVDCVFPSASYEGTQEINSTYSSKGYLGWKYSDKAADNANFIKPLPETTEVNVSGDFNVENYSGHASSSLWVGSLSASIDTTGANGPTANQLKFTVPFQGGEDGVAPWTVKFVGNESTLDTTQYTAGTNLYGFNLSNGEAGHTGYKKALDILSNQDEYDINMLALPGVIKQLHSAVTTAATDMVETRGDAFYVMDLAKYNQSVNQAVNAADGLDSNYAAVYYPWVKVLDTAANKPVLVPPSVIVPGAIAASDKIGAEWFAPAGLNRGVLGNVLEAKIRLNQSERDRLYDAKINPIATFPQTGVAIWGQKTLQERSTALDRINVRRLLIAVKKYIASSSRYLVFEQNTQATRNRFLNIVNPYLESVQQRQGLYAFRVQMDEANNTPDVIDRNQLVGAIYLQPTKTAEFIVLDFNVLPTGATFDA